MSRIFGTKFFSILSISSLITFTACDESSVVGLDVQPQGDLLNVSFQDTTTLITRTQKVDSLQTDESLITFSTVLLGVYNDPAFGKTSASVYTQLKLPSNIIFNSFGTNPVCDSIVLSLTYDAGIYYGKSDHKAQTVNVYQLLDELKSGEKRYSNKSLNYSSNDLAQNYSFIAQPLDSVAAEGKTLKPHLRIPLQTAFGQVLLDNQGTGNLANNAAFQSFLKGFYITTENTSGLASAEGNILHFRMGDAQSKVTIYYNSGLKYDLSLNGVSRFNHFGHDFTVADAYLQSQLSATPPAQDSIVFVQSLAGTKVKIEMPYLLEWLANGPVSINKAELVIKVNTDPLYQLDTFAAPPDLVLFGISDDGSSYTLPDVFEGSNYFGGDYNSTTKEYRYNIGRYIQQVLTDGRKNNGLYLLASGGAVRANRVVVGGGSGTGGFKMKLNITYTKLH